MTDDKITNILRDSGVVEGALPFSDGSMRILRKFADLVRAKTKEECAKVCEEQHEYGEWKYDTRYECATAIREMK